jgi:hypothetical protein
MTFVALKPHRRRLFLRPRVSAPEASELQPRPHISGIDLVLKPGKKIGQAWRATGWWPDHYSIAIYDIAKVRGGSKLTFTQIGIPPNRYSGHYRGWIEAYWTPMKEIFATGTTSEPTKAGVKIDRQRRIKTGRFRRTLSKEI